MFTFHRSLWVTAAMTALTIGLSGCAGCEFDELGCKTDEDCRTGRVCGADNFCTSVLTLDTSPDLAPDLPPDLDETRDMPTDTRVDLPPFDEGSDEFFFDEGTDEFPRDEGIDLPPFDEGNDEFSFDEKNDESPRDETDDAFDVPLDIPNDDSDESVDVFGDSPFDMPNDETPDLDVPPDLDMSMDFGPDEDEDPDMGAEPQIRVTPGRIDFGVNPLNTPVTVDVLIENIGVVDLDVTSVGLRATPSQGFSVTTAAPIVLQPGQATTASVTFSAPQASRYANDLEIQSDDADEPLIQVPLDGRGFAGIAAPCLYSSPDEVDFGVVTPGNMLTREVIVGNCSSSANVTVTSLTLRSAMMGAPSGVSISSPQPLPFVLGVGQTELVTVTYTPTSVGDLDDVLRVRSDSALGPISRVDLVGSGGGCPTMVARGESNSNSIVDDALTTERVFVVQGDVVDLDATLSTSPSGRVNASWSVSQSPAMSAPVLTNPQSARAQFRTSTPGRYVVELDGTDPVTTNSACATDTLDVTVLPNLPELIATMTWTAPHDVDLHILRSDAQGNWPMFFDPLDDLSYDNVEPDWGGTSGVEGDAFHYGDDLDGFGPEHAIVTSLDPTRDYRVIVQFTRILQPQPRQFQSTLELTINPAGSTQSQTRQFSLNQRGQQWVVYDIDGATGAVTLVNTP